MDVYMNVDIGMGNIWLTFLSGVGTEMRNVLW